MPDFATAIAEMNDMIRSVYAQRRERLGKVRHHSRVATDYQTAADSDTNIIEQMSAAVVALGGKPALDPNSPEGKVEIQDELRAHIRATGGVFGGFVPRENLA